jgi:hypothetical protein
MLFLAVGGWHLSASRHGVSATPEYLATLPAWPRRERIEDGWRWRSRWGEVLLERDPQAAHPRRRWRIQVGSVRLGRA